MIVIEQYFENPNPEDEQIAFRISGVFPDKNYPVPVLQHQFF